MKSSKIKEGKKYLIRFLREIRLPVKEIDNPTCNYSETYNKGDEVETEIPLGCLEKKKATLYFENPDDGDYFIENVPLDAFEVVKVQKVTWKKV